MQLANLLDSVPGSVFICTKSKESQTPHSVYANLNMNTFFGCDIVNYRSSSKRNKPSKLQARKNKKMSLKATGGPNKVNPLKKPIF